MPLFFSAHVSRLPPAGWLALGLLMALIGCGPEAPAPEAKDVSIASLPDTIETLDYKLRPEVVTDALDAPWAIAFIDADTALITEQPGRLRLLVNGTLRDSVRGTPAVSYEGVQGGLLDVAVDPDYADNGWVYLSYAHVLPSEQDTASDTPPPAMTRVVRGRIRDNTWQDQEVVLEAPDDTYRSTRQHFGSRLAFDHQGLLYVSIGDRGDWPAYPHAVKMHAQALDRPNGKIHRVHRDGTIPSDNPFVGHSDALPSVFTYGHRNPQGLATHPETGVVWALEHGPRGGDELNRLHAGANYGWPEITYGIDYDGSIISPDRRRDSMKQPTMYWRPSIATSGLSFYQGEAFPYWHHQALASTLKMQQIRLLTMTSDRVMHQEVILDGRGRVREAIPAPDGSIYVVLNTPDRIVRLTHLADFTARD